MKQALIVFIIALGIGSILNSMGPVWDTGSAHDAEAGSKLLQLTDKNFKEQVLDSDKPVLVDFWATWCGPCKAVAPTVEQIAQEYAGKVRVMKLNIDDARETADHYNVHAIPAFFIFKGGKPVAQMVGAAPKEEIVALIEKAAKDGQSN